MKHVFNSKTIQVNVITFLIGLVTLFIGQEWIASYPEAVSILTMFLGILNVILRTITNQPVSFK